MPTLSTATYWQQIRREGAIVGYWRGNESSGNTTGADSGSRYGLSSYYDAEQNLGPALIKNDLSAGSFSTKAGSTGFHILTSTPVVVLGDISLEAWIAPFQASQSCQLIGKVGSASNYYAAPYALRLHTGTLQFAMGNGASETSITAGVPSVATPTHVVATNFRGVMNMYVNGVLISTGALGSQAISDAGNSLCIAEATTAGVNPFYGLIGEVALYAGALSANRIARHYSLGQQIYPDSAHYFGVDPPVLIV